MHFYETTRAHGTHINKYVLVAEERDQLFAAICNYLEQLVTNCSYFAAVVQLFAVMLLLFGVFCDLPLFNRYLFATILSLFAAVLPLFAAMFYQSRLLVKKSKIHICILPLHGV